MNVKRFTARTSREALALVRQAFGEDAVVLSTKPCAEGVEVLAMAPRRSTSWRRWPAPPPRPAPAAASLAARAERQQADRPGAAQRRLADRVPPEAMEGDVNEDVERMAMSTLSFQDYVRDRMLRRRQAALEGDKPAARPRGRPDDGREPVAPPPRRAAARPAEPLPEPAWPPAPPPRSAAPRPARSTTVRRPSCRCPPSATWPATNRSTWCTSCAP
jgi:flagellar biosynthesis protein FlhF